MHGLKKFSSVGSGKNFWGHIRHFEAASLLLIQPRRGTLMDIAINQKDLEMWSLFGSDYPFIPYFTLLSTHKSKTWNAVPSPEQAAL